MRIIDLLAPERVACKAELSSKKRALEHISTLVSEGNPALEQADVFASLLAREKLGSTGLGEGVALPHGRVASVKQALGGFVTLAQGIDFDALDGAPVDLMFALIVPEDSTSEHLAILAQLAEMFRDHAFCSKLRATDSAEELLRLLGAWQGAGSSAA